MRRLGLRRAELGAEVVGGAGDVHAEADRELDALGGQRLGDLGELGAAVEGEGAHALGMGEAHLGPGLDGVVQVDRGLGREGADQADLLGRGDVEAGDAGGD